VQLYVFCVRIFSSIEDFLFPPFNEQHCCVLHDAKRRGLKKALQEQCTALLLEETPDMLPSCFLQMFYMCLKVTVLSRASITPLLFRKQTNISCQDKVFQIQNVTEIKKSNQQMRNGKQATEGKPA